MFRYLGMSAVKSVPALTLFAAMLVPSCASTKDAAIAKTAKRVVLLAPSSSRNNPSKSRGDQIVRPLKMTVELEAVMMPIMLVKAKPHGIVKS